MTKTNPAIAKYASMTEDEQFRAVLRGDKPMCEVDTKHETSLPCIETTTTVEYTLSDGTKGSYSYPSYLYYNRGLGGEAKRAAYLLNKHKTKKEHRELGLLLGYDKSEVEAWTAALSPQPRPRTNNGSDAIPTQSKDSEEK